MADLLLPSCGLSGAVPAAAAFFISPLRCSCDCPSCRNLSLNHRGVCTRIFKGILTLAVPTVSVASVNICGVIGGGGGEGIDTAKGRDEEAHGISEGRLTPCIKSVISFPHVEFLYHVTSVSSFMLNRDRLVPSSTASLLNRRALAEWYSDKTVTLIRIEN